MLGVQQHGAATTASPARAGRATPAVLTTTSSPAGEPAAVVAASDAQSLRAVVAGTTDRGRLPFTGLALGALALLGALGLAAGVAVRRHSAKA